MWNFLPRTVGLAGLVLICGCSSRAAAPLWENFSGVKAFVHVQHLVELGPRPAGSEALEKSRIYIIDQLKSASWTTTRSEFSAPTPRVMMTFLNLDAHYGQKHGPTKRHPGTLY